MPDLHPPSPNASSRPARFRVLLTEDRAHADEHWTRQLPVLLRPMGVDALIASSGQQALDLIEDDPIHAAIIDLATPKAARPAAGPGHHAAAGVSGDMPGGISGGMSGDTSEGGGGGGIWLMQVLQRLPNCPPIVVVNSRSYSQRQVQRLLNQALELGAFSVVNRPVRINTLLATFQRLVERAYNNTWPDTTGGAA